MWGPHIHPKTSTDDSEAIIETQKPITCHQLCLYFIPYENNFGIRTDPTYALV